MKRALLALAFLALAAVAAVADERPLADWVPADAGVCIEADRLAEHADRFAAGPLYARLQAFPPWQRWRGRNEAALKLIATEVGRQLGLQPEELWRGAFGRECLLATWPPPATAAGTDVSEAPAAADRRRESPGLLLVRSEGADLMQRLVEGFRDAQQQGEGVRWQTVTHAGLQFFEGGSNKDNAKTIRVAALGRLGVLTDDAEVMRRVLELHVEPGSGESLAASPAYQQARAAGAADAAIRLFVNPRPWDALLRAEAQRAPPDKQHAKQMAARAWGAVRYWSTTAQLGDAVMVQSELQFDPEVLPGPVAEALGSFEGGLEFFEMVPADCLLAAGGRIDFARLLDLAAGDDGSPRPLWEQLIRFLGPELGGYVVAAESAEQGFPVQWVLAIQLRRDWRPDDLPEFRQVVEVVLPGTLTTVARMQGRAPVTRVIAGGAKLTSFEDWRKWSQRMITNYTFAAGHLFAGTSAGEVTVAGAAEHPLARSDRFRSHLPAAVPRPSHALYVDSAGLHELFAAHADEIVAALVEHRGLRAENARKGLEQMLAALRLADTVVAAAQVDEGALTAGLVISAEAE